MLAVDLIVGVVIAGAAAWGFRRGLMGTIAFAGFAVGAVLGSRVPLLLGGNLHSTFSLASGLPAALLLGGLMAMLFERIGSRLGRRLRKHTRMNAVGGTLAGGFVALVAVWALGPVAEQVGFLQAPVEDSTVLARFNSVLAPAGPKPVKQTRAPTDNLPIAGPPPRVAAADPRAERDPDVKRAERGIVKIGILACGHPGQGSGWVVADQIVVTNAHVVASADAITVRSRGTGPARGGTPIWFDPLNDFALLRVPSLRGVPPLPMVRAPRIGASGAALGFPAGIRDIRRARIGPTTRKRRGMLGGEKPGPGFSQQLFGRLITTFRGSAQPGSSGGPVVDTRGRVLTTVFAGNQSLASGFGVPNRFVREALPKAGPTVSTGRCLNDSDSAR